MSRRATGQVIPLDRERGRVFALRFRAYGRREYVTTTATSYEEAEAPELEALTARETGNGN